MNKPTIPSRVFGAQTAFLLVYLVVVSGILYILFAHAAYDDPFITYRYAENLANGKGFVYNPGLRIQSTTTPLFTLVLAAISLAWQDLPRLANLFGALSISMGGLFIWDLSRAYKAPLVGWAGLLLYPTFPLLVSTLGSETPLYLAFCLGAFACYARKMYNLTGLLCALAVLTRPDGALIPLLLAVDYLLHAHRSIPWKAIAIFLGLTLTWFLIAWGYFGSPIPVTLAAKQHQGSMGISQRFAVGLLTVLRPYAQQWYFWLASVLALLGVLWSLWRARAWTLILIWTVIYFAAYSVLGVSRYFWYYAPLVPGFVITAGLGCEALSWAFGLGRRIPLRGLNLAQLLSIALLLALMVGQCVSIWRMSHRLDSRIGIYRAVGEWLRTNTPPEALVGTLEAGAIGYYSDRPLVDFAGLIQPEVAVQLMTDSTYDEAAQWAVQRFKPDYIVVHEGLFPGLERGYLAQSCQVVKRFTGKRYQYNLDMSIYACQ